MKKIIVSVASVMIGILSFGQIQNPVTWSYSSKKVDNSTYEIQLTATIQSGWHIYSQKTPEGGPIPTSITFNANPLTTMQGGAKEKGKLEKKHEEIFGVDVMQYSNKVSFTQTVKLKSAAKTAVSGSVEFMVCNDTQCLPPKTEKFLISLK